MTLSLASLQASFGMVGWWKPRRWAWICKLESSEAAPKKQFTHENTCKCSNVNLLACWKRGAVCFLCDARVVSRPMPKTIPTRCAHKHPISAQKNKRRNHVAYITAMISRSQKHQDHQTYGHRMRSFRPESVHFHVHAYFNLLSYQAQGWKSGKQVVTKIENLQSSEAKRIHKSYSCWAISNYERRVEASGRQQRGGEIYFTTYDYRRQK